MKLVHQEVQRVIPVLRELPVKLELPATPGLRELLVQ
ncbi:hypothetical protein ALO_04568 [Acetonema longum DSM 6540]|uniref:Uncharacterized protein n=1 Tax=Acetonema longum DSM 6540 TaxID=1009370 RepID=F7NFT2_9FIRM|nr:hypothetical protein ALO_04568 [Acetonema longum DSM 6540]